MGTVVARIGAGFLAALLTGAAIGAFIAVFSLITDPGARGFSVFFLIPVSALYGLIVGGIPGALVVSLSRARYAPWRSVPILTIGTSCGFLCGLLIAGALRIWDWVFIFATIGALAGGVVATRLLRRSFSHDVTP